MEAFAVTVMVLLAYWLTQQGNGTHDVLPTLGALAMLAQRMLPVMQAVYGAWSNILSGEASVRISGHCLNNPFLLRLFNVRPNPSD
jgi:ATP-binding cassette subfamily B protein